MSTNGVLKYLSLLTLIHASSHASKSGTYGLYLLTFGMSVGVGNLLFTKE